MRGIPQIQQEDGIDSIQALEVYKKETIGACAQCELGGGDAGCRHDADADWSQHDAYPNANAMCSGYSGPLPDNAEWREKQDKWFYIARDNVALRALEEPTAENGGNIDLVSLDGTAYSVNKRQLRYLTPPPPSLPDGWELTGKILNTGSRSSLALGEIAYSPYSRSWKMSFRLPNEFNNTFWIARQENTAELFICHLIDNCEGSIVTEEFLQVAYADFLKGKNCVGDAESE